MIALRPYQQDCVDAVVAAARTGQTSQLVVMATGLGKTVVFVELAKLAAGRSLILAHRDELIRQTVGKLIEAGVDPNEIGVIKGEQDETERRYTVASVQTLARETRLARMATEAFGLLVIDEAHHSPSDSYRRIVDYFAPKLILGVTATPDRLDGKGLAELFGSEPVYTYGIRKAIADGWLVNIRQYAIRTDTDLAGVHTRAGDFATGELADAVNTHLRNALIVESWTEMAYGRPTVAFAVDVQHALDLADEFCCQGFQAAAVHANTPKDERRAILASLHNGAVDVVANCAVLTEGWDCPPVSCVIMARPTKSRALYQQCVGRGLRTYDGKDDCLILDITDNCKRHKLATVADLLGTQTDDFEGRTLDEIEHREREQIKKRVADGCTDWTAEEVDAFLPLMLEGYTPREVWHDYPPTDKQIAALAKCGYDLGDHRPTRGECAHLLDCAITKKMEGPPTSKQLWFLRGRGYDPKTLTFKSASVLIGHIKSGAAHAA